MKYKLGMIALSAMFMVSCANEPKPADVKAAEEQVAKDQAAADSMEKVIQQQIDAVSEDSLMQVEH